MNIGHAGVTLVEPLVVIAIVGVLVALLLPAIQASREAARDAACKNNLRQVGVAVENHLSTIGHYPTGGWGGSWTGDPRRGFGAEQPGGWVYGVLDFLEQSTLGRSGNVATDEQQRLAATAGLQTVLPGFICPTRRPAMLFPHSQPYLLANSETPEMVARSDYAINAGDAGANHLGTGNQAGPPSEALAESGYDWPASNIYDGIAHFRSQVRARQILYGFSNTYLAKSISMLITTKRGFTTTIEVLP